MAVYFVFGPKNIPKLFLVSTLVSEPIIAKKVYKNYIVIIFYRDTVVDLGDLDMVDLTMIPGMDWLHSCYISLDCRTRKVTFYFLNELVLEWEGNPILPKGRFISYLRGNKMISEWCLYHLIRVKDSSTESPSVYSLPVVNEFPQVFSKDLPEISSYREIDFRIYVFSDTQPISIPPYRMAFAELRKIKI